LPKIEFVDVDAKEYIVDAEIGVSVMVAAVNNGVPGIDADCGGALSCATCHVYVAQEWLERLAPPMESEQAMIECAVEPAPNSRLSCQLNVTEALEGLVLYIPKSQS
jgi:ferredoxin, 2Fe-2S